MIAYTSHRFGVSNHSNLTSIQNDIILIDICIVFDDLYLHVTWYFILGNKDIDFKLKYQFFNIMHDSSC